MYTTYETMTENLFFILLARTLVVIRSEIMRYSQAWVKRERNTKYWLRILKVRSKMEDLDADGRAI
jgi:hypothetical protein